MSFTIWRIATDTRTYEADDLSGAGAAVSGGRWNEAGDPMVYGSETRALACLETIVDLNAGGLPLNRKFVSVAIPGQVWARARTETPGSLPVGWDAMPAGRTGVQFGTGWLRSVASALLRVPSVIVPDEFNVLINRSPPDSGTLTGGRCANGFMIRGSPRPSL